MIGYHEIAALLPHRFPFQFIDRVLEFEDGVRIVALKNVSINEPYFRGHFPEQPLMPGVLICEALAQAAALLAHRSSDGVGRGRVCVLAGLDRVRFRRPVLPGDQLYLEVVLQKRRRPMWKMSGTARVDGHVTAEAELSLMETERTRRP
ncbi:MAG TPA: 3-hydroxyacyl-ACP dehydratase FabZ [Candidatus Margulisiibacteriota bacterium]|nr:3-hydroxyacyl-ACP dehydratase FabZ [Candidatus Margulisiibacteriota bacterium]